MKNWGKGYDRQKRKSLLSLPLGLRIEQSNEKGKRIENSLKHRPLLFFTEKPGKNGPERVARIFV